jgi:hypothetical protein
MTKNKKPANDMEQTYRKMDWIMKQLDFVVCAKTGDTVKQRLNRAISAN